MNKAILTITLVSITLIMIVIELSNNPEVVEILVNLAK